MKLNAFAYLGSLVILVSLPAGAAESHCQEQEQIIFSCSLGKKMVSVCASTDLSSISGYLQYRFGQKNALELAFPALTEFTRPHPHIQARTLMFSGGGGAYLRFVAGDYNYIVYTTIGKGWGVKEGVAVEKNHRLVVNMECQDIPVSKLGEEFFSRTGLSIDQHEFLIPGLD